MNTRILIPSYDFKPALGGVAHYVHEVASQWAEMGCDVTVLARAQDGDLAFDARQKYKVVRIVTPQTAVLSVPSFVRAIRKYAREIKPAFVFCPLWFPDGVATYLSRFYKTIPYVVAAHGSELYLTYESPKHFTRSVLLTSFRRAVLSTASLLCPGSQYTKALMASLPGANTTPMVAPGYGVDTSFFKKNASRFPFAPELVGKKILLTVTRLCDYKGVDYMLRALPEILRAHPDVHYVVVGKGPDSERLKTIVRELKLESVVTFTGPVPYESIIDFYSHATLFVMLSREQLPDVEGFGLVFLEAAACGLPSLGGNSGGIPDAVLDGRTGWLVDPASETAIARKVISLLASPEEIARASAQCLLSAPQRTWRASAQTILNSALARTSR